MKRLKIYLLLFLAFAINANAQENGKGKTLPAIPPPAGYLTQKDGFFSTKGMSANTALLLVDLMQLKNNPSAISEKVLIKKYGLIKKGGKLYANSFLMGTKGFTITSLGELGVLPGSKSGDVFTAMLPIERIAEIVKQPNVRYVNIGDMHVSTMDSARRQTNVDKVHAGTAPLNMPYTGKGVVVGIIDDGFDYTHPNFYDSTGQNNYRVKRVWNQNDTTGTPPTGYPYGSEYITEAQILNAKSDYRGDHGSHVAGIAAGAGAYPGSPYRGVAYESDLVMVSKGGSDAYNADAIKYIQDYAKSVGKPCVINMSFISLTGPHDGTTLKDKYRDSLAGPGKLLVHGSGNDGMYNQYIAHNFLLTDTVLYTFPVVFNNTLAQRLSLPPTVKVGITDIWGNPNENFAVRLLLLNTKTNTIESKMSYKFSASIGTVDSFNLIGYNGAVSNITISSEINPLNNKPHIEIVSIDFQPDSSNRRLLIEVTGFNTNIQMWGAAQGTVVFSDLAYKDTVLSGNVFNTAVNGSTDHGVADGGGCGRNVITVGAYTSKNNWMSVNNKQNYAPMMGYVGDIASFSSMGPTADGRTKPEITAPGNIIASSINSFSPTYNMYNPEGIVKSVTYGSKTWYFGMMEGTSMSTPMVTGILALWLQKYPNLTREQALDMMKKTAITDSYTGTIPATGSNTWGWGKINAFMGMTLSVEKAAVKNTLKVYPNPANNLLHIAFDKQANNTLISISDVAGKIVYSKEAGTLAGGSEHVVNMGNNPAGIYVLRIVSNGEEAVYKIVKQ